MGKDVEGMGLGLFKFLSWDFFEIGLGNLNKKL